MALNDAILEATGGPTISDGLRSYFLTNGATAGALGDLERQFLLANGAATEGTNDDLWRALMEELGFTSGALNDRLLAFWDAGGVIPSGYFLRADFGGDNVTLTDGQDVETQSPGSVQDGAWTNKRAAGGGGTQSITSNKWKVAGVTNHPHWLTGTSRTRAAGLAFKATINRSNTTSNNACIGFADSATFTGTEAEGCIGWGNSGGVFRLNPVSGESFATDVAVTSATDFPVCMVLGGYTSGVPDVGGSEGCNAFAQISGTWTLIASSPSGSTAALFPTVNITAPTVVDFTCDDTLLPDDDLSAIMTPANYALDLFAGTNGDAVSARPSDSGHSWTNMDGTVYSSGLEIQSNTLRSPAADGVNYGAYLTTVDSDVFIYHKFKYTRGTDGSGAQSAKAGAILRLSDNSNFWFYGFWSQSPTPDQWALVEYNAGVPTVRASFNLDQSDGDHEVQIRASGSHITCAVDGGNPISYASATFNQTAVKHGLVVRVGSSRTTADGTADNFHVRPLGSGYDAVLDSF